jgi:hypothetical protein
MPSADEDDDEVYLDNLLPVPPMVHSWPDDDEIGEWEQEAGIPPPETPSDDGGWTIYPWK